MSKMLDLDKVIRAMKRKQATIERNSRKLKNAPNSIFVGWNKSSGTYPEQNGTAVSYVGLIHELGLGNQTEKRMVKGTIDSYGEDWRKLLKKMLKKGFRFGRVPDYQNIATKLGEEIKNDIRTYIYIIDLVDTERLANSVIIKYKRRN